MGKKVSQKKEVAVKPKEKEMVNHPDHYKSGKFEVIDIIDDFGLGFDTGNCIKYILRAGKKDPAKQIEDLKKAEFYLKHEIEKLEKEKENVQ